MKKSYRHNLQIMLGAIKGRGIKTVEKIIKKELFDEGITVEIPGEYCLYCGIPLKTEEEKKTGLCQDHLEGGVGK